MLKQILHTAKRNWPDIAQKTKCSDINNLANLRATAFLLTNKNHFVKKKLETTNHKRYSCASVLALYSCCIAEQTSIGNPKNVSTNK